MKFRYIITLLVLLPLCIFGQGSKNESFALLSFVKPDTILLRWAPMNPKLLRRGLKYGFTVERIELSKGGKFENNPSLKTFTIKPFDKNLVATTKEEREFKLLVGGFVSTSSMKESEEAYTYGVLLLASSSNKKLSKMLNLSFIDSEIENKIQYKYRIGLNHKYPKSVSLEVNANNLSKSKDLTKLNGKADHRRKQAYLKWEVESLQSDYAAYWIERSIDSLNFKAINKTPYVFFKSSDERDKTEIDFVDKTVEEGITYWYRIKGINHFAEIGGKSNVVKISMKRILKGIVKIDTIYAQKLERIIKGKYEAINDFDSKTLKKFVLLKSKEMHQNFSIIGELDNDNNSYHFSVNSLLSSGDRNYYKVGAISVDNDTIYTFTKYFFTLDQIPPSQPKNLSGTIDDKGVVKLQWDNNPEDDIRGYRVFRSNSMKEEFVEDTKYLVDTLIYRDTLPLNNLTSEVFYRISAVDLNYNNSDHSEAIKLLKPDTIPPVPCLFIAYNSDVYGIKLEWINSSSIDVVQSKLIIRKATGIDSILVIWNDTLNSFVDSTASLGQKNTYIIKTVDKSDNSTNSKELTVIYETGKRPSVSDFTANLDLKEKGVILKWKLPKASIYSLKIYKAKNEGAYRLIKTIRKLEDSLYFDKNLTINNSYSYKIKVVYQSGITSEFSIVKTVNY